MKPVQSLEAFRKALDTNLAVLAYFSSPACSVCAVLKPKVDQMVSACFPQMTVLYISSEELPELAAQYHVFTAPTVLVFFQGRETIRKSRAFGIEELKAEIQRPYSLLFE